MGVDPAQLGGPIIGVASTWTGTMPCNLNQRELADRVSEGVTAAGGLALGFNTIALPVISAGATLRAIKKNGKFQGVIPATTPMGRR